MSLICPSVYVLQSKMPPVSVAVVGHSCVRNMRDYVLGRPQWHNTDVPRAVANVSWICFGGASVLPDVPHRSAYSMLPQLHSLTPESRCCVHSPW